jgi:hypothetical protein
MSVRVFPDDIGIWINWLGTPLKCDWLLWNPLKLGIEQKTEGDRIIPSFFPASLHELEYSPYSSSFLCLWLTCLAPFVLKTEPQHWLSSISSSLWMHIVWLSNLHNSMNQFLVVCVCVHMWVYTHMSVYMCVHVSVCACAHVCVCVSYWFSFCEETWLTRNLVARMILKEQNFEMSFLTSFCSIWNLFLNMIRF